MSRRLLLIVVVFVLVAITALGLWRAIGGGCGHWDRSIGLPGMDEPVRALAVFDNGDGASIYAGGFFAEAGGQPTGRLARWDGNAWHEVTRGLNGPVRAMAVVDDANGSALYVAGQFTSLRGIEVNHIVRYDGSQWSPIGRGADDWVLALTIHDDGSGPNLYAAGEFTSIGGQPANRIARWDGEHWNPLGDGLNGAVYALASVRNENGIEELFAAGAFRERDDHDSRLWHIARWDGEQWRNVGDGLNDLVFALTARRGQNGSTEHLIAGGRFTQSGAMDVAHIAQWDGNAWSAPGGGLDHEVLALAAAPDGSLYAGGRFTHAGKQPLRRIAKWNGAAWNPLRGGADERVQAIVHVSPEQAGDVLDAGLYVGGSFTRIGMGRANRMARWRACEK